MISNTMEPVDIKPLESDQMSPKYLSVDQIDEETEKAVLNSFKKNEDYKIKQKRRIKIITDIETKFKQIAETPEFGELYRTKTKPLESSTKQLESGIVVSSGESFAGMKIGDNWHKFKDEVDLYLLLKGIVHRQTISTLKWRFKKSIEIIKRAKSYADTEEYDKKSIVLKSQPPA
jgi:hypothetical protein